MDRRQERTEDTPVLRNIVHDQFFQKAAPDKDIIKHVCSLGIAISRDGLRRIRQDIGIFRRTIEEQREELVQQAREFFITPSLSTVLIPRLGRRSL